MTATRSRSYHIHAWKCSSSTYYKHILYSYLKQHPNAPAKSTNDVMTNVIQTHINDVIEAVSLQNKGISITFMVNNFIQHMIWIREELVIEHLQMMKYSVGRSNGNKQ